MLFIGKFRGNIVDFAWVYIKSREICVKCAVLRCWDRPALRTRVNISIKTQIQPLSVTLLILGSIRCNSAFQQCISQSFSSPKVQNCPFPDNSANLKGASLSIVSLLAKALLSGTIAIALAPASECKEGDLHAGLVVVLVAAECVQFCGRGHGGCGWEVAPLAHLLVHFFRNGHS